MFRGILTFLFIVLVGLSPSSRAEVCDYSSSGWQSFLATHWTEPYRQYQCSDNVWRLKQQLERQGCRLDGVMTVVFRKLHPQYDPLVAQKARGEDELAQWSFHQVLVYDGLVIDLDYTDEPQVVEWSEYLENMFVSMKGMWMQIKPLQELKPSDLYGQFSEKDHPLRIADVLEAPNSADSSISQH